MPSLSCNQLLSKGSNPLSSEKSIVAYHTTTDINGIRKYGLKTKREVKSRGLGGGSSDLVSFTVDPEYAKLIADEFRRAVKIANGYINWENVIGILKKYDEPMFKKGKKVEDLWTYAKCNTFTYFDEDQCNRLINDKEFDLLKQFELKKKGFEIERAWGKTQKEWELMNCKPDEERFNYIGGDGIKRYSYAICKDMDEKYPSEQLLLDTYRWYLWGRSSSGGRGNPVFYAPKAELLKGKKESDIKIIKTKVIVPKNATYIDLNGKERINEYAEGFGHDYEVMPAEAEYRVKPNKVENMYICKY